MNGPIFSELIDSLKADGPSSWSGTITDNWMQGRTTYGGLSAALCLQAAYLSYPDLPPLRSASINFVGPTSGKFKVTTIVLRAGKSVTYISAELTSSKGLATHAVLTFGASRESHFDRTFTKPPQVPQPEQSEEFLNHGLEPQFLNNFERQLASGAMPISASDKSEHYIWVRHNDQQADNLVALMALADMPPPAVFPMFKEFAPVSSMNWMMNYLSEDISTEDGWWLMRSAAEHARDGYSSQDMQVWNSRGELIITGRQNVAIFY
ncbi:MAG: acyl-CoA thioesterase [Cryomorphaceae bacterium]|jgi:acyl-CoA thioesterase